MECTIEGKESKLRWFGRLARRGDKEPIKTAWRAPVEAPRSREIGKIKERLTTGGVAKTGNS